tara:strand:+ start:7769 stop:8254 length:486 start_codon:yes stop_codon:yes gene_type:complete
MRRRDAVQNIALITSGSILFPSCKFSNEYIVGDKVLDYDQLKLIKELSEYILPIKNLKVDNPEDLTDFIITMLNDCYSPMDMNSYLSGLDEYNESIKVKNNDHSLIFDNINSLEAKSEKIKFFINTTKNLSITHFTTSEFYLTEYLNYEYAPSRYLGCVPI